MQNGIANEIKQNEDLINQNTANIDNLQDQLKKAQDATLETFSDNFAKNITGALQGITRLTYGISALNRAFDALENQDLT